MEDKELFNHQKYEEIIAKYEKCINDIGEWQLYYLCRSYYKMKLYRETIQIYRIYCNKGYNVSRLEIFYLWSIYQLYLNLNDSEKDHVIKAASVIVKHCTHESNALLYTRTINKVIKFLENEKVNPDYNSIYFWIMKLKPELLDNEEKLVIDADGQQRRLAGEREQWYAKVSKTVYKLERYEETVLICEKALREFDPTTFHNNNDIWFQYRIAMSKLMLGREERSIEILKELRSKNEHFCFSIALGEAYARRNDMKEAKRYFYEGLSSRIGTLANKVSAIEKIADIMLHEGDQLSAKRHYLLVQKIRSDNMWRISEHIITTLNQLDSIPVDCDIKKLEKQCLQEWSQKSLEYLEQRVGKVVKILPNRQAGFIQTEKENYYFRAKELKRDIDYYINKEVSFYVKESYDIKKQCKSFEAIKIKEV